MKAFFPLALAFVFGLVWHPGLASAADEDDWLGQDKALHFGVSALLESGGYWLLREGAGWTKPASLAGAAVMSLGVGLAKELTDETFSVKDMAWNGAGVGVGSGVWYLADNRQDRVRMAVGRHGAALCYERRF